jgi:hypothetical protein
MTDAVGKHLWWLAAIGALYLALATAAVHTYMPWVDEAWFATPGLNLAANGAFGTSTLDETAAWKHLDLRGINRFTYWIMPLHPLAVAGWTFIGGTSLFAVRTLSMLWGLVALAAWFLFVRKLAEPGGLRPALFMAALLAMDFEFIQCAGTARMDMMTEAMLSSAFASYLLLRERNFIRAVLVSQSFMMLAGMTHPIALGGFAGLLFLTLYFDWRRVRVQHVALAALPYAIGAAAWSLYISLEPAMFWHQFSGNVAGRLLHGGGFLPTVWEQYKERFLWIYGWAPESRGFSHIKIMLFLILMGGLVAGWALPDFRHNRNYRACLILCTLSYVCYACLDRDVHEFYLVHIMAPVIAVLALVLDWLLRTRRAPVWSVAAVFLLVTTIQLTTTGLRIRQDAYHRRYLDTTAFIQEHAKPNDLVMGSSELGWQLGWNSHLVDDYRLGFISGKRPDIVVLDKNRYQEWIANLSVGEPQAYQFIQALLENEFRLVHRNAGYAIYSRKNLGG